MNSQHSTNLEEKLSDTTITPVPLYEINFNTLVATPNYTQKTASEYYNESDYKKEISNGLRVLRSAELLTTENQAAVLVAEKHAFTVACAIEALDDANLILSNEIRLALVKAGEQANEVVKILMFLNDEGIINIKDLLGYTNLKTFLSVDIQKLKKHVAKISKIHINAGNNKVSVDTSLRKLISENIFLTKYILSVIDNDIYQNIFVNTLIELKNVDIPLTVEICRLVSQLGSNSQSLIQPFKILREANISFTDDIIEIFFSYVSKDEAVECAQSIVQLEMAGIKITDTIKKILLSAQNVSNTVSALVILKQAEIELTEVALSIIANLKKALPGEALPLKIAEALIFLKKSGKLTEALLTAIASVRFYPATVIKVLMSLVEAEIPLTEKIIAATMRIGYSNLDSITEAWTTLKAGGIEITDIHIPIIISSRLQNPLIMAKNLVQLHIAGVPLSHHPLVTQKILGAFRTNIDPNLPSD